VRPDSGWGSVWMERVALDMRDVLWLALQSAKEPVVPLSDVFVRVARRREKLGM